MSSRGHTSHAPSGADRDAMQRVRYMAHMERRARPPTFRPLTIVVVVLAIGLLVIGLIMIVIAHWPGVSGGGSLKIAGGVLLAVGGVVLIISLVLTCVMKSRERERFEKSIATIAQSRSNVSMISRPTIQTGTPTPSLDARPGKSILKKTPSTSTYGTNRGSVFGEDDSGVANTFNSFGQNHSYQPDSEHSDSSGGKFEVYRIETLPDPTGARKGGRGRNGALPQQPQGSLSGVGGVGGAGLVEHSSTDSEQVLPTAVRTVNKKRRAQSPSVSSSAGRQQGSVSGTGTGRQNPSYVGDGSDTEPAPRRRQEPVSAVGSATPSDATERRRQQRQERFQQTPQEALRTSTASLTGAGLMADMGALSGFGLQPAYNNEAFMPQEADLGYPAPVVQPPPRRPKRQQEQAPPQRQPNISHDPMGRHNTSVDMAPRHNTSQLSSSMDEELRINIKAQPGTAVHITPTGSRKFRPPPRATASPSQSSVETEI